MLTIVQAETFLEEAGRMNPGVWTDHSRVAAETARVIAKHCKLDEEKAYVFGLLHDIGRREGVSGVRHIFDGYAFLKSQGFDNAAAICLTHSFPDKDAKTCYGNYDCTENDLKFLQSFLDEIVYDEYHMLIQLCDALSLPHGAVLMEKRLIDIAMRYGIKSFTQKKWNTQFKIKEYFDNLANKNIYDFIPNIKENTFAV
jgi:hypothetical protein